MKKQFLLNIIFPILFATNIIFAEYNEEFEVSEECKLNNNCEEKNELDTVDQSIFNEENENNDEDTVNLFQFSTDSIQQSLNYNVEVLDYVNKFISFLFHDQADFEINEYLDQYISSKKFQFLSCNDLQNCTQNFEFVTCFLDFRKINNSKKPKIEKSDMIFFYVKSLIYEYLATNKVKNYRVYIKSIFDGDLIKKIFSNTRYRQRINKYIKENLGSKKNVDFCQYLHFIVLDYKNTLSIDSIEKLFQKYSFPDNKEDFEKYEPNFLQFINDLRHLDEYNDEFQSSLDVVRQNILQNPKLLSTFLSVLVDKPICFVKNTEINQNIDFFVYNYCKN